MNTVITIEMVKGGFVVTCADTENKSFDKEVVQTPRKLIQLIKEKVEQYSTTPNTDE